LNDSNVELNKKPKSKGHGSTLEETWPDYVIYSAVTSTKLPMMYKPQEE